MKKLKDLIANLKASIYGAFGRVQAAAAPAVDEAVEKIVEAITEESSTTEAPAVSEVVEENCLTSKKTPAKKSPVKKPASKEYPENIAKKPGRPKGSINTPKS